MNQPRHFSRYFPASHFRALVGKIDDAVDTNTPLEFDSAELECLRSALSRALQTPRLEQELERLQTEDGEALAVILEGRESRKYREAARIKGWTAGRSNKYPDDLAESYVALTTQEGFVEIGGVYAERMNLVEDVLGIPDCPLEPLKAVRALAEFLGIKDKNGEPNASAVLQKLWSCKKENDVLLKEYVASNNPKAAGIPDLTSLPQVRALDAKS